MGRRDKSDGGTSVWITPARSGAERERRGSGHVWSWGSPDIGIMLAIGALTRPTLCEAGGPQTSAPTALLAALAGNIEALPLSPSWRRLHGYGLAPQRARPWGSGAAPMPNLLIYALASVGLNAYARPIHRLEGRMFHVAFGILLAALILWLIWNGLFVGAVRLALYLSAAATAGLWFLALALFWVCAVTALAIYLCVIGGYPVVIGLLCLAAAVVWDIKDRQKWVGRR
jgi:hypothetical protein